MDPISGLLTMLILIAFAYGMYLAYQKFVVEGGLFDSPTPLPEEPIQAVSTPTSSVWEVPGVNSEKGRPNSSALYSGNTMGWYGKTEKLIGKGRAKTASACYEASKVRGINNWGWDRTDKSCFAYVDSNILGVMGDNTKVEGKGRYVVGCTEPGVTPISGCMDWTTGNVAKGWNSVSATTKSYDGTLEQCRKTARDEGYDAFLYLTNRYGGTLGTNVSTCQVVNDAQELLGFTGTNDDYSHVVGCADPSKKVVNACM